MNVIDFGKVIVKRGGVLSCWNRREKEKLKWLM